MVSAYHRKIAKDRANDEGLVVNPDGLTNMPGDGPTTYPSDTAQALIPYKVIEETYDYYEVRNYVNDVNQAYTQVLTSYDHNGKIRESYTYGLRDNGEGNSLDGTYLPGSDTAGQNMSSQTATGSRILSRLGASPANSATSGLSAALGGRLDYGNGKQTWYYGYTGTGSVSQLTDKKGILATAYSYDAFGNTTVQDYTGNLTGNRNIIENYTLNPYTYNGEYTDASTRNQYLRARYYSPETGNFFTEDSYLGSLLEPLERNLYSYAENDPVNYSDPSGHGILKKAWNKVKSTVNNLIGIGKSMWNTLTSSVSRVASNLQLGKIRNTITGTKAGNAKGASIGTILGTKNNKRSTAYQRAKASGQSIYNWEGSRSKEAKNIQLSWTKALENTIKRFCTDAKKIEKQIGLARLEANKKLIMPGVGQAIAVSGTTDFGQAINNLINAGLSAGAAKEIVSKLISAVAGSSAGSVAGIIGGTAVLWWFSPMEAGESEEQATECQKEDQKKFNGKKDPEDKPKNPQKVDEKYLKKREVNAHKLKKEYLGNKADIAKYDIYVDKTTGRLWIYRKYGKGVPIPTYRYIK